MLDAFVRGTLPWGTRMGVEGHIDGCADCAELVAEMARLFASSQPPEASVSPDPSVTMPAAPPEIGEGAAVGRYHLGRKLGEGAMGLVFEAHDPQLHRKVAIKLLHPRVAEGPDGARLLREARSMAQLAHPNVVAVHDAGRADAQVFVAMELVEGLTLRAWLDQRTRPRDAVLQVFVQAGRGLEAAHAQGIVHRDFKPDNVMVGRDGRARVADFGLARPSVAWPVADATRTPDLDATIDGLTRRGAVVGTPAYMAPEQWHGRVADARSDQFAFCVALYEALCGERPFAGRTLPALADAVTRGARRPMARSVPGWLREAVERGLQVDARARHPSMTALLRQLERDRGSLRRGVAMVGAMAVGAAATVGVLRWMADETTPSGDPVPVAAEVTPVEPEPAESPQPGRACKARVRTVDGAWNEPRRTAFVRRLESAEDADAVLERTLPRMDAWAERYAEVAAPLCDPASLPSQTDARARCLADTRRSFDALVAVTGMIPVDRLARGIAGATYELPDVTACEREPWLQALPQPPLPQVRPKASLIAADVAGAQALGWVGAYVQASDSSRDAVSRARALGHAPLLAQALLVRGRIAARRYEVATAIDALEEAVALASEGGAPLVTLRAATELLRLHGAHHIRGADVQRWQRTTGASVERLGDPYETAAVMRAEAEALRGRLELREAETLLREALPLHTSLYGAQHPRVAAVHVAMARTQLALEDASAARDHIEAAVQIAETTVGPLDLRSADALRVASDVARLQERFEDAVALGRRATEATSLMHSRAHEVPHGLAELAIGDALLQAGDRDAATQAYHDAKNYLVHGWWASKPLLRLAEVPGTRTEDAVALATEAVRVADGMLHDDDVRRTDAWRGLARAQRAHDDLDGALASLQAVATLVDAQVGYGPLGSRSDIEMGEVVREMGDAELALKLFDGAHVAWVGAYGLYHPRVTTLVLARADLAWGLGNRDYARRLYGNIVDELETQRGRKDPATVRARDRAPRENP